MLFNNRNYTRKTSNRQINKSQQQAVILYLHNLKHSIMRTLFSKIASLSLPLASAYFHK
jgi:hypothetical protein